MSKPATIKAQNVRGPLLDLMFTSNALLATIVGQECERLQTKPFRTCLSLHHCRLCGEDIRLGEEYWDGGSSHRGHRDCVIAGTVMFKRVQALMAKAAPFLSRGVWKFGYRHTVAAVDSALPTGRAPNGDV